MGAAGFTLPFAPGLRWKGAITAYEAKMLTTREEAAASQQEAAAASGQETVAGAG